MSVFITKVDSSDLKRVAAGYRIGAKLVDVATVRAMNRGLDAGAVVVRKELIDKTGITDKDTRRSKGITKRLATVSRPRASVVATSSYTPLSYFRPQATPEGVRANPWNRQQTFAGTFMLRMSTGYVGVFKRDTTAARETITTRAGRTIKAQPIKELWGPSLAVEMTRNGIPGEFNRAATERTIARLPTELQFELNKAIAKRSRR